MPERTLELDAGTAEADLLRTTFEFELPRGYVDPAGTVHRQGTMRLATARDELVPLADFGSTDECLQQAQRRFTTVVHHANWLALWDELVNSSRREAVRFISVSQAHAGDFLNAVPNRQAFRVPTWAMRTAVQRRLGLPLTAALAASSGGVCRTARGGVHDTLGDSAQNVGRAGHAHRHRELLEQLTKCLREAWGSIVEMEPTSHLPYSDNYRPDVTLNIPSRRIIGELKLVDPLSSNATRVERRGAFVPYGNTMPGQRAAVYGRAERGAKGDRDFDPATGQ